MKSSTNQTKKTITAYEQKPGEATGYALVVKRADGSVITRPLLDPVPAPAPPPSPVPVASVSVTLTPTAVNVGETAKVAVVTRDLAGNVLTGRPWTATVSNTGIATFDAASSLLTGKGAGTATVTVTSEGVTSSAALSVSAIVVPDPTPTPLPPPTTGLATRAELPRATPLKTLPVTSGTIRRVGIGGDLRAALSAAQPGDTVLLAPGATFTGNFTLRSGTTLRTDIPSTPVDATDRRMTPSKANALNLAKLVTTNTAPALSMPTGTRGCTIADLEIYGTGPIDVIQYGLLWLGDGGDTQKTLADVPTDAVVDRVYIHGSDSLNCRRGIALQSANTAVLSSWVEIHAKGFDAQAIGGWNGPGPYLIDDCYLAGSGENIMFGGGDPAIQGLSPSDITIRRNHITKAPTWKGVWTVKNLFELKNARRILVEQNVCGPNWADAQVGMAIVIKSSGDANAINTRWQGTTDVTFRYNIVRDTPVGFNLLAVDSAGQYPVDVHVARVTVEHNLFMGIGPGAYGSAGMLFSKDVSDVRIAHNSFIHAAGVTGLALELSDAGGTAQRVEWLDNIMTAGKDDYAIHYSDANGSAMHSAAIQQFAGTSWAFRGNIVSGIGGSYVSKNPPDNEYPSSVTAIGLAPDGSLSASSPYRGRATDGTDPGANITEITRRTAGVVVAG